MFPHYGDLRMPVQRHALSEKPFTKSILNICSNITSYKNYIVFSMFYIKVVECFLHFTLT